MDVHEFLREAFLDIPDVSNENEEDFEELMAHRTVVITPRVGCCSLSASSPTEGNKRRVDRMKKIGAALEATGPSPQVEELYLSDNEIDAESLAGITGALGSNVSLRRLDLPNNLIKAEGMRLFIAPFQTNLNLQVLNLSSNMLGDDSATTIAAICQSNFSLNHIMLNNNRVANTGAAVLAEMVEHRMAPLRLDLDYNQIGDSGGKKLVRAYLNNGLDHELHMLGNHFSRQFLDGSSSLFTPRHSYAQLLAMMEDILKPMTELECVVLTENVEKDSHRVYNRTRVHLDK